MTVIKSGKEKYRQTCPDCSCIFAYGTADIHGRWVDDANGEHHLLERITCPECGSTMEPSFCWNPDYLD